MNLLKKLFHQHQWKKTYGYLSTKDIFASPIGNLDCSGSLTEGQKCVTCGESRSKIAIYAKDGSVEGILYK